MKACGAVQGNAVERQPGTSLRGRHTQLGGILRAIAFGKPMLAFLLFLALPISFLLARSNLLRQPEQPRANTDAPNSIERERAIAPDDARVPGARNP